LHIAQRMPLPLTISCFSKSRLVLPLWYLLTRVVPDRFQQSSKTVVCLAFLGHETPAQKFGSLSWLYSPGHDLYLLFQKWSKYAQINGQRPCCIDDTEKQNTSWHHLAEPPSGLIIHFLCDSPLSSFTYILSFLQIGSGLAEL